MGVEDTVSLQWAWAKILFLYSWQTSLCAYKIESTSSIIATKQQMRWREQELPEIDGSINVRNEIRDFVNQMLISHS